LIPYIDHGKFTGCSGCAELYPMFFVMRYEKAWVINHEKFVFEEHKGVLYFCPFGAITVE
jgi:hypothetical protein